MVSDKSLRQRGKIFHVRTEENGFARKDWLDWILPAARGETLADKNNRRDRIPILQLTRAVEKQTIGRRFTRGACLAAQANIQSQPL